MSLSQLNEYARKHEFHELPDMEEIDDVLPLIWKYLREYNLSDSSVPSEKWQELMGFLDYCKTRSRMIPRNWNNR
jgi:hypothetical protein